MIRMAMGLDMQQQMRASPALVALNAMLVLSTLELQQLVQQELEDNPALEQLETVELSCDMCGRPMQEGICFACLHADRMPATASDLGALTERELDPLLMVAAPLSVLDLLERDVRAAVAAADYPIVDYLIGSLDGRGFLDGSPEEAAAQLGLPAERVLMVLRVLQELGPAGIAACSTQECLLLQIERLERGGMALPLLRTVVSEHWDDFTAHRFTELSRTLGVNYDTIMAVRDLIRSELHPYPLVQGSEFGEQVSTPLPDVIISAEGDKFVVDVAESRRFALRLSPIYQDLARAVMRGGQEATEDECEHLRSYIARARLFLKNMRHRRDTIRRISEHVVQHQDGFLRHGIRHLAPLTRTEVAEAVSLHESTVSRATANKYVLLPAGEIIPFSHFFSASLSVKDALRELINAERAPLTDEELVGVLQERGYQVARRTVAKYRNQLKIPPSTVR